MIKYVLTTETAIVDLVDGNVKMHQNQAKAIKYNTIGEAMADCVKVNKVIGYPCCKIVSVEVS